MKIINANIKTVDKLTKYITPSSIEKARFQRYNAPKIKDTNLRCDKFFRTEELFNKETDVIEPQNKYSLDDLPIYDRTSPSALNIRLLEGTNNSCVESDVPFYVDIIGEKQRVYLEDYGNNNTRYPFENNPESAYRGFSIDEVVNIKHYAQKIYNKKNSTIEKEALGLLKQGYPLSSVIKFMQDAALKLSNGKTKDANGFMTFLAEFPGLRKYMVTYTNSRSEAFDALGAKSFGSLVDMCNGDKKLAYRILWNCRIELKDGRYIMNHDLFNTAKYLYKLDNTWTKEKEDIMQIIATKKPRNYKYYLDCLVRKQGSMWERFRRTGAL